MIQHKSIQLHLFTVQHRAHRAKRRHWAFQAWWTIAQDETHLHDTLQVSAMLHKFCNNTLLIILISEMCLAFQANQCQDVPIGNEFAKPTCSCSFPAAAAILAWLNEMKQTSEIANVQRWYVCIAGTQPNPTKPCSAAFIAFAATSHTAYLLLAITASQLWLIRTL